MKKLYYITGLSGTGKSTVLKELQRRGYNAHGVDEEGFANWHDKTTGDVIDFPHYKKDLDMHAWFAKHDWILDRTKVETLKNSANGEEQIFLCGSAMHEDKAWNLFDKVFSLIVDLDTAKQRIQQRTDNQFGQSEEEWESVAEWHGRYKDDYTKLGAIFIDATQPVDKVADDILKQSQDPDMLTYNNGQIYYETVGSGELVVFVHGFSLDHTMWQPQVEFLKSDHQVVTYDARGFGKSSLPDCTYSHVADLLALLNHLGIKQAHLVGLSMGGRIVTNFALAYPDMVKTITLMDSALDGYESEVDWSVHAKEDGLEQAKENWLNHEIFTITQKRPEVVVALRTIVEGYSGWHWLHNDTEDPANTHARDHLHEIKQPTLILVGEGDLKYFHNIADVLADGIPNSQKVIIKNAGHMVSMEAVDEVNKVLADFIARSKPATKRHRNTGHRDSMTS